MIYLSFTDDQFNLMQKNMIYSSNISLYVFPHCTVSGIVVLTNERKDPGHVITIDQSEARSVSGNVVWLYLH